MIDLSIACSYCQSETQPFNERTCLGHIQGISEWQTWCIKLLPVHQVKAVVCGRVNIRNIISSVQERSPAAGSLGDEVLQELKHIVIFCNKINDIFEQFYAY